MKNYLLRIHVFLYIYAFILSGIIFQVEVYGPGIEPGIRVGAPTEFTVDCSKSGPGDVTVNITSAKRKTVPVSINDNGDDTYTGKFNVEPNNFKKIEFSRQKKVCIFHPLIRLCATKGLAV